VSPNSSDSKKAVPEEQKDAYQLSLHGEGLDFQRTVSERQALDLIAVVMGGGATEDRTLADPPERKPPTVKQVDRKGPQLSVGEYLSHVEARRNPDKITAIVAYLKVYQGRDRVHRKEIRDEFPKAGESVPGNFTRDLGLAVRTRWLATAARDEYYITQSGIAATEGGFSGDLVRPSAAKRRAGRKAAEPSE